MPLNFPDNPVDNQVYSPTPQKAWVYNASQGTWLASNVSSQGTKVTVQDAAPQGSDQGDLWFNSETGSLNVNYDDTTSEQWVNISSSGIIESEDVINDNTMLTASESTLATSSSIKAYVDDIVKATVSLDDIKMFNFRSNGDVSKGYMESGDIDTAYRGSLPVSFDSDVKFVELKYTSAIANVPSDAEDSVNGTVYIDWENKKIKQSSVKKDGGNPHQSHWYESTGAESNGVIMFNSSEGTTGTPEGSTQLEGIVIDWDNRQITGLPLYTRDSGGSVSYKYDWQYIFRDLTNSGSFGSAGSGGGGSSLLKYGEMSIGRIGNQTNDTIPTVGDFTAVADDTQDGDTNDDTFVCTFNTPLDNNNYNVVFEVVSNGRLDADNTLRYPVIVDKTSTGFVFNVEFAGTGASPLDSDHQINVRIESNQANAVIADQKWEAVTGTYDFDQSSNLETSEFINSTGSPLVIRAQFDKINTPIPTGSDDINIAAHITHVGETTHVSVPFAKEIGFYSVSGGYANVVGDITIPAGATYKFVRTTTNYTNLYWYKMTTTAVVGSICGLKDPNHAGGTLETVTTSFKDLDLSSIVGSNKAQVTMEAYDGDTGCNLFFRRKGSVTDLYSRGNVAGWGASSVTTGPLNEGGIVNVITDSSGFTEYRSDGTSTGVKYKVLTYQVIS